MTPQNKRYSKGNRVWDCRRKRYVFAGEVGYLVLDLLAKKCERGMEKDDGGVVLVLEI